MNNRQPAWVKQTFVRDKLKNTVNYCVLINKLLELMRYELIQLGIKTYKYTADEQFRLTVNNK